MAGLLLFSAMAAYAFATFKFKGSTLLYLFFLIGLMVPPQALIISGFKWMAILKLLSTYWALIFTYFGWTSFGILVLRNFFESVPGGDQGRGPHRWRRSLADVHPHHDPTGPPFYLYHRYLLFYVDLE
ncbi:MAG: hypothetical protein M5U28_11210 [Sandaracinaceae bacterium]|nr:hypothetical protein [Sandaracinaceae bacterium]